MVEWRRLACLLTFALANPLEGPDGHTVSLRGPDAEEERAGRTATGWKFDYLPQDETFVVVKVEDRSWYAAKVDTETSAFQPNIELNVTWTADDVSVVFPHGTFESMRGPVGYGGWSAKVPLHPRIEVLASPSIPAADSLRVRDALLDAQAGLVWVGTAQKERERTVVFTPMGREEQGKKLAALIPGGADLDLFTWETSAEMVIGLGKLPSVPAPPPK